MVRGALSAARGFAGEGDAVGVMDQAVEDGVGDGGLAGAIRTKHAQSAGAGTCLSALVTQTGFDLDDLQSGIFPSQCQMPRVRYKPTPSPADPALIRRIDELHLDMVDVDSIRLGQGLVACAMALNEVSLRCDEVQPVRRIQAHIDWRQVARRRIQAQDRALPRGVGRAGREAAGGVHAVDQPRMRIRHQHEG